MFGQTGLPPDLVNWANVGVLGLVILSFFTGRAVPGPTHQRVLDELDKLAERAAEQDRWIRNEVVPLVTRNTDVLQQVLEILRQQLWRRKD